MSVRAYLRLGIRRHRKRPMVRPWALSAPILVLLISIPLLRPLRHPDWRTISDDEQARLASIQALVEHGSLAIEKTSFNSTRNRIAKADHWYSDQPPVMATLLSGPYRLMYRGGISLDRNPTWAMFLLTLLGTTLPVALATGLLYRMGRLFELTRPWRAGLAMAAALATGWISYATVLNAHATAAAIVVSAAACLVQVTVTRNRFAAGAWLAVAGFAAALGATIDPSAVIFLFLLLIVIAAFRWPVAARIGGMALYSVGAVLPILLHATLNRPITGDLKPGFLHPELSPAANLNAAEPRPWLSLAGFDSRGALDDDDEEPLTRWRLFLRSAGRFLGAFFGTHGLFTHFPVLILGIMGVSMVMHRHWPTTTKAMAGVTLGGALAIILAFTSFRTDWHAAMFGTRWFVVFLPLTLFWSGAWLRRGHRPWVWATAGVLLAFSIAVSLIGATGPLPRDGFDRYTAAGALMNFVHPPPPAPILAGG